MPRTAISAFQLYIFLLTVFLFARIPQALATPDCTAFLKAANTYDELDSKTRKLVQKHSIFPLTDWSNHSSYEAILLVQTVSPKVQLIAEVLLPKNKKTAQRIVAAFIPWKIDPQYYRANFDPITWIGEPASSAVLTLRLEENQKLLCQQDYKITSAD